MGFNADALLAEESEVPTTNKDIPTSLNAVDLLASEEVVTSGGFSAEALIADSEVSYTATYNEPKKYEIDSSKTDNPNFIFAKGGDFWKGFDEQKSDIQNWALILESKVPMSSWHNRYSKPLPEGAGKLDIFSAQELYGYDDPDMPKWEDMGSDARRIRLLELFNNNLDSQYPNRNNPDRERTKAEIGGSMLGALTTPTSLFPVGKSYKVMIGIGAALGFEWGVAEGLADEGEINWKDTAQYTALGAFAAPLLIASGRGSVKAYKKYKLNKNTKLQLRSAQDILDDYDRMMFEAIRAGEKPADIPTKINSILGINVKTLREYQKLTGRKTKMPTKQDVEDYYEMERYKAGLEPLKTGGWIEDFFGLMSTRIRKYDESLLHRLRKIDFNQHIRIGKNSEAVAPFLKGLKKLNKKDREQVTLSLFNGDFNTVTTILNKQKNKNLLEIFEDTRIVLNTLHKEAKEVGLNLGYLENYFPRELKNGKKGYPALLKFLGRAEIDTSTVEKLLAAAESKSGKPLTISERGEIVNKFLLSDMPSKFRSKKIQTKRIIDTLGLELLQFYKPPAASLNSYISRVVTETEKIKFFGTAWNRNALENGTDVEKSIGVIIDDLLYRGKISGSEQIEEVKSLLQARFTTGEQAPSAGVQRYKNLTNAALLGNPLSAATQLGDVFLSAYKVKDILGTLKTLFTQSANPLTNNKITLKQMGYTQVAEELTSEGLSASYMRTAFKWSGFRGVDRIGKETLINRAFTNYTKAVKTKEGLAKFRKKWTPSFGDDMPDLIKALKKGDMESNDVKLLLWHDLSDMQPVSLSEMPLKYLENPNGRLFYMLKTFTLKQFDVMRRDGLQLMKAMKPKRDSMQKIMLDARGMPILERDFVKRTEGLKNLTAYAAYFTAGGVSADVIKDALAGKEISFDDIQDSGIDKLWNLIGLNKYSAEKINTSSNLPQTLYDTGKSLVGIPTSPWISLIDESLKAASYYMGGSNRNKATGEFIEALPFGNVVYLHFMGGKREDELKERKRKKKERANKGNTLSSQLLNLNL